MVGLIASLAILVLGGVFLTVGAAMMSSNQFVIKLVYNGFNVGLMFLIVGISIFLALGISIPKFVEGLKYKPVENE